MYLQSDIDACQQRIKDFLEKGEDKNYNDIFEDLDSLSSQHLIVFFDKIFLDLDNFLLKENYVFCVRALKVIKDLLKHYESQFSLTVNNKGIVVSLYTAATNKKISFDQRDKWDQFQMQIRGIFFFWFKKYQQKERKYQNLIKYYTQMRQKGFKFPQQPIIIPLTRKQKNQKQTSQLHNNFILSIALEEILSIIQKAQKDLPDLQSHPEKLKDQQQFVSVLKAKSKYLYLLSTRETSYFTEQEGQNILRYCKRTKNIIKRIDIVQALAKKRQAEYKNTSQQYW